ncbi:MAG: hypothetical protein U0165_07200 [Polyangiaceae bacterium]
MDDNVWLNIKINEAVEGGVHVVFLLDSLDRLPAQHFVQITTYLVNVLRKAKAGIVVVGHDEVLGEIESAEVFDRFYRTQAMDVESNPLEREALIKMLRCRVPDTSVLADAESALIATLSGGILRDLFLLARDALEESWVDGTRSVTPAHIERASAAKVDSMLALVRRQGDEEELRWFADERPGYFPAGFPRYFLKNNLVIQRGTVANRRIELHPLLAQYYGTLKAAE